MEWMGARDLYSEEKIGVVHRTGAKCAIEVLFQSHLQDYLGVMAIDYLVVMASDHTLEVGQV